MSRKALGAFVGVLCGAALVCSPSRVKAAGTIDTTGSTVLPMIVDKRDLGVANARLMFGNITINRS